LPAHPILASCHRGHHESRTASEYLFKGKIVNPTSPDLSRGLQLEQPNIFIPWEISEDDLRRLFQGQPLKLVTNGYFTTHCISLRGVSHELGFHFRGRDGGALLEFEFFRGSYMDLAASFQEFQQHLEETFGPPTHTESGTEGFPSYTWQMEGAEIVHFVQEHFGPAESVRIRRKLGQ
jgi:hypothetical protein